jgi:hypothetical protein
MSALAALKPPADDLDTQSDTRPASDTRADGFKLPLTCGAPLRNRTVDLLLTMETLCRLS